MKQYLKYLQPDQKSPIPGQEMTKNNAGGYSFTISDQERLERFLLLGTDGGTYYVSEDKLTAENADFVIKYIKKDGISVFRTVKLFADQGRAPKYNSILFTYALMLTFGNEDTRALCYDWLGEICYTPTQLFQLLTYLKPMRGWSRGLRNAVAKWYLERDNQKLAYQLIKYRQRSGYTHRDTLRLCHAKTEDPVKNMIFKYAVGKVDFAQEPWPVELPQQIRVFESLQKLPENAWIGSSLEYILDSIKVNRLTWEMIPTERLNNPELLKAILADMPPTALMRNLNRYAYNGLTDTNNETVAQICAKLRNLEELKINKIHPVNVINTMLTYSKGVGEKGSKVWTPNQNIIDALHDTYELATSILQPTNKKIILGVDKSGSMSQEASGMSLTCIQLSNILAHTILRSEPNVDVINFDTQPEPFPFGKKSSLTEILKYSPNGGGTDCGIPIVWATHRNLSPDVIIIITDNETWAGKEHPIKALQTLRKHVPNVKVIEIALASTPYTSFPNDDLNVLRIVGFDASVIQLIQEFIGRV